MICGRKVHEDSIFIAAYNPDTMATDGTPLEKPMANRFFHADWKHDKQSWDAGMIGEEFKPAWVPAAPKRSDWMRFVPKIGSLIVSYTNKNSGELNIIPEDDSQYAFPHHVAGLTSVMLWLWLSVWVLTITSPENCALVFLVRLWVVPSTSSSTHWTCSILSWLSTSQWNSSTTRLVLT